MPLKTFSHYNNVIIDNAIADIKRRLNYALAKNLQCNSDSLSILFKTYCMNMDV